MNTDVQFFTMDGSQSARLPLAEAVFHVIEARFSRFLPQSDLSTLNACAGRRAGVSRELLELLELSQYYHCLSGGAFDPAVLPSLEAAGYDRSFELIPPALDDVCAPPPERHSIASLVLDRWRTCVSAPAGLRIDLGGIAKGYAVDEAARVLAPLGDFLIDAGGDIYASGAGPAGDGWLVGVADPFRAGRDFTTVRIGEQALATSSVARRCWQRGGVRQHHLIDPRTGRPAQSDAVAVSVLARHTIDADVFAKVALLLGHADGARFLDEQRAGGLFVRADGSWTTTTHWPGGTS